MHIGHELGLKDELTAAENLQIACILAGIPATDVREALGRVRAPVLGSVVIGGTRVRYSLPAWTPVREGQISQGV